MGRWCGGAQSVYAFAWRRGDVYYTIYVQSTHSRARALPTLLFVYLACAVSMLH